MPTANATVPPGPLKFPPPKHTRVRRALVEHLGGHTTSQNWLPEGLSPELDSARSEMLRLRERAAGEVAALSQLDTRFRDQDAAHAAALQEAFHTGGPEPEDTRTSRQDREAEKDAAYERVEAAILVMAHHAEQVVGLLRQQEPQLMDSLRVRLSRVQARRREAEQALAQAAADEWRVHREGQWVLNASADGPFGRQPAPSGNEKPPARFDPKMLQNSLTRPWWKAQPDAEPAEVWSGGDAARNDEVPA